MTKKKGHDEIYYLGYAEVSKEELGDPYPQFMLLEDIKLPKRLHDRINKRIEDYDEAIESLEAAFEKLTNCAVSFKAQIGERNIMFNDGGDDETWDEDDPRGTGECCVITEMDEQGNWLDGIAWDIANQIKELKEIKKMRKYQKLWEVLAVKKLLRFHPESIYDEKTGHFVKYAKRKKK